MSQFVSLVSYGGDAERRERILKQKRDRYKKDEEHRAAKLAKSNSRYKKVKKPSGRKRGRNKPKVHALPNGKLILLLGLGQAADLCGVSKQTFRRYETQSVIPLNRLVDAVGRRWYPKPFVEWLVPLLQRQSAQREPLWCLKRRVEQAWAEDKGPIPILEEQPHE